MQILSDNCKSQIRVEP